MILLVANPELKKVFKYLIESMKQEVEWDGNFLVLNNNLILPGRVRSLFFCFDSRKLYTNVAELNLDFSVALEIDEDSVLSNLLNMTLYVFGKWGLLKGLRVEKTYTQLNMVFNTVINGTKSEADFREDTLRFYQQGLQITYEDVIQQAIELQDQKEEENDDQEPKEEEGEQGHVLGLWHSIKWVSQQYLFHRGVKTAEDMRRSRLGNNFYMVDYICPICGNKLYMILFPVGQEQRIETDEGAVYLARAYSCGSCCCLFAPKPGMLLKEGEIYQLIFEDDKRAYEDYLELLGKTGTRACNYKFNEYEWQRNQKEQQPKVLDLICENLDTMTEKELAKLSEKLEDGFYPEQAVTKYKTRVKSYLTRARKNAKMGGFSAPPGGMAKAPKSSQPAAGQTREEKSHSREEARPQPQPQRPPVFPPVEAGQNKSRRRETSQPSSKPDIPANWPKEQKNQRKAAGRMKKRTAAGLKQWAPQSKEPVGKWKERTQFANIRSPEGKNRLNDRITAVQKRKNARLMSQMQPQHDRFAGYRDDRQGESKDWLKTSSENRQPASPDTAPRPLMDAGNRRAGTYQSSAPEDRRERLSPKERQQEELYQQQKEQQEISGRIKRADTKSREGLWQLYQELGESGYSQGTVKPYLEKIHDKLYDIDKKALEKLCPNPSGLDFAEGLQAYEEITNRPYLPELKINMMEMLDKRLSTIKKDEQRHLVQKLQKGMSSLAQDGRLYFCDLPDEEEAKRLLIETALDAYAQERDKYEYPLLVCDASGFQNGKSGVVLTPDHIFYHNLLQNGKMNVRMIDSITAKTGLLNKGIYVSCKNQEKLKLPILLEGGEWKPFADAIGEFIKYLQEKPQSRSISYLVKEKHEKICCYRCGYVYTEGNVCPKCGSKMNS